MGAGCANLTDRAPARYLPFDSGRYEVRAGLRRFGADFGNGEADRHVFQIDRAFPRYRAVKRAARAQRFHGHVLARDYPPEVAAAVTRFIVRRLSAEHPDLFTLREADGGARLHCRATGERLRFDEDWRLAAAHAADAAPPYASALDALACQVPEDLAVTVLDGGRDRLAALHVCLPSHWAPEQKIGRSFADVHAPVPGIEPITRRAPHYVEQMIRARNGLVRFVWGIQRGDELNRHPHAQTGEAFDGRLFVRVERQTIWGLPEVSASLFIIRPYLVGVDELNPAARRALAAAIRSMSAASAAYKGIADHRDELIHRLES